MKKIGIITNPDKDIGSEYTKITADSITKYGGEVFIPKNNNCILFDDCSFIDSEAIYKTVDAIICIGGDGTFLKVARNAYLMDLPLLGVNLGRLGFLTEIDKDEIDSSIKNLLLGNYTVENRMVLEGKVYNNGELAYENIAINDIVASRIALSRILHLNMYINDVFADAFPGDGIIVASPTGSTAYSLSAGGPIVEPDTELMIITPICPHILYSRSVITKGTSSIKLKIDPGYESKAMLSFDGQTGTDISKECIVEIIKAEKSVKIIRLHKKGFFSILRSKIHNSDMKEQP